MGVTREQVESSLKSKLNPSHLEIHGLLRQGVASEKISFQLSPWASALFEFLPPFIRNSCSFTLNLMTLHNCFRLRLRNFLHTLWNSR